MVPTASRARRLATMSGDTKCTPENNGGTLEELMLSRASMTGTGDLIGGDTLAGGGASEAGDRMLALLWCATTCAPRAVPARRDSVSAIYAVKRRRRAPVSSMTMTSSSSLGYVPIATKRGA